MALKISPAVQEKLDKKHGVKESEIVECFANCVGKYLDDTRQRHKTDPKTLWFVSETDRARKLKVAFILHVNGDIEIKSAFPPNATEQSLYNRLGY